MSKGIKHNEKKLFTDIIQLIEDARHQMSQVVNASLTITYWNIGERIQIEILNNERAEYGKQIVASLSGQLIQEYGSNYSVTNLRRMIQFYEVFPDSKIVVSLIRQLSWTHFIALIPIKDELQRDFYTQMCRIENWSVRTFGKKFNPCFLNARLSAKSRKN